MISDSVSITTFMGREKSGNHLWNNQIVNFPSSYSSETYWRLGDEDLDADLRSNELISAFSDNEGIILITKSSTDGALIGDLNHYFKKTTIRFHRIYRNHWFLLGRYNFRRRNTALDFSNVFMFQGRFFLHEIVKTHETVCGWHGYCFDEKIYPPKLYSLDRENDKFVKQKLIINYKNFDYFEINV